MGDSSSSNNDAKSAITPPERLAVTRAKSLFQFVATNLAVVSAITVVASIFCIIVFLYAYLVIFDWHLIWLLEYADILKFGLVALGAILGVTMIIFMLSDMVVTWHKASGSKKKYLGKIAAAGYVAMFSIYIIVDERSAHPLYELHIYMFILIFTVIYFTYSVMRMNEYLAQQTISDIVRYAVIAISTVSLFGLTFGLYARDAEGFKNNVTMKSEHLDGVIIIMMSSHHIMLYTNDREVIVVPTADVTKITHKPSD